MEFSDPQRTLRHIEKAHQSKKKFECNSCGQELGSFGNSIKYEKGIQLP